MANQQESPTCSSPLKGRLKTTLALLPLLIAAFGGESAAQTPPLPASLSLADSIAVAIERHPKVIASRWAASEAHEQVHVAESFFRPQVNYGTRFTYIDEPRSVDIDLFSGEVGERLLEAATFFEIARQSGSAAAVAALDNIDGPPFTDFQGAVQQALPTTIRTDLIGQNFVTTQLSLIQPLWAGGRIRARYEQAQAGQAIAQLVVAQTRNELALNVSRAYLSVLLATELSRVASDAASYAEGVAELAEAESGASSDSDDSDINEYISNADIRRARTLHRLYQEQALGMKVSAQRALAAYKLAVGLSQAEPVTLRDKNLPWVQHAFDSQELLTFATSHRPEARQARYAVRLARLERKVAQAEFHPQVGLFSSYSTIADDAGFANPNDPSEWAIGVSATVPLYSGGRLKAQSRLAAKATARANQQRTALRTLIEQQVMDAYLEHEEMSKRQAEAALAVQHARIAVEALGAELPFVEEQDIPKHYEEMLTNRFLLLSSQVRYAQTVFGYNVALARIRWAAGMSPRTDFYQGHEEIAPGAAGNNDPH